MVPRRALHAQPTTDVQLRDAMRGVKGFLGVFAVDTLPPKALKDGQSCIVNLQTMAEGGSHWVACVRLHPYGAIYWCPFGAPPDDRVRRWLGGEVVVSTGKYQQENSKQCGQFCVFFLRHLLEHRDLYGVLYHDLHPDQNNENKVKRFFRAL